VRVAIKKNIHWEFECLLKLCLIDGRTVRLGP
jgi:hypothetical protein